jgi:RNA polymerase sigma-70 factor, ECF subfamily
MSSARSDTEAIWEEFHRRLLGFIARRVSDRDSAEDILQEVMLRIHRHSGELEHSAAVGGWIHQIARNAIVDHYRRAPVRRERPAGIDPVGDDTAAPATAARDPRNELARCLAPLLEQLPDKYREAVALTELDGVTQADAAARLGLSTSGMKSRVQRGRAQLKDLLADCCEIELDRRGGVTGYQPRHDACDCRTQPPTLRQRRPRPSRARSVGGP